MEDSLQQVNKSKKFSELMLKSELEKYQLTENQLAILNMNAVVNYMNNFPYRVENVVKTVSATNLDEKQMELLGLLDMFHLLQFDRAMKAIASYHLDENQLKIFTLEAVQDALRFSFGGNLDPILKIISSHHLTDKQIDKLGNYTLHISDAWDLEKCLSNMEKYNQPYKPWGAWISWGLEKIGYGGKEAAEVKLQVTEPTENNTELVSPVRECD